MYGYPPRIPSSEGSPTSRLPQTPCLVPKEGRRTTSYRKLPERSQNCLRRILRKPAWEFNRFVADPRPAKGRRWPFPLLMRISWRGLLTHRRKRGTVGGQFALSPIMVDRLQRLDAACDVRVEVAMEARIGNAAPPQDATIGHR